MNLRAVLFVAACSLVSVPSVPAFAADGEVRVTFANGRVTVIATDATLPEILQEWARVGGSRFINAEKIPATERLTLRLENEPEMRAIEVLLRSVAGYVVAPRMSSATADGSSIGNVVIQASTRAGTMPLAPMPVAAAVNDVTSPRFVGGPPRPDDDGPTQQQVPPPPMPMQQVRQRVQTVGQPAAPIGQASPLSGAQTQTMPGLGAVTSSQPGAVIPNTPQRPMNRPGITPTQPRRPGGGG